MSQGLLIANILGNGLKSFTDSYQAAQDRQIRQGQNDALLALRRRQMEQQEERLKSQQEHQEKIEGFRERDQRLKEADSGVQYDPKTKGFIQVGTPRWKQDIDYREEKFRTRPQKLNAQNKVAEADAMGTRADSLRKEFSGLKVVQQMQDIDTSMLKIEKAAKNPSAAGDLSLIFGYMRMLDPGSTVREGEFANAQNAAGVPDRIRNMYNRTISGERLNPDQRNDFLSQSYGLYNSHVEGFSKVKSQYDSIAKKRGLPLDEVTGIYNFGQKQLQTEKPSQATPPQTQKQKVAPGQIVKIKGRAFRVLEDGDSLEPVQ